MPGNGSRQPRALLFHSLVLYGFQPRGFRLPGYKSLDDLSWNVDYRLNNDLTLLLADLISGCSRLGGPCSRRLGPGRWST